jgi:hypothetical protein
MPTMKTLLDHWEMAEPYCRKCLVPQRLGVLERAHLIDHARGGLDGVQNLVPLCWDCHKRMPSFKNGDETEVLQWISTPWEGWMHDTVRLHLSKYWNASMAEWLAEVGFQDLHSFVVHAARIYAALPSDPRDAFFKDDPINQSEAA